MPSTPRTSTPYPAGSDAPLGPAQMQALAENLEKYGIPRFASSAARDAAITSPTEGDFCYRTDIDTLQMYEGTGWMTVLEMSTLWASYTPTVVGITVGTGGATAGRWRRRGSDIDFEIRTLLGTSGFSVGTGPTWSLPVPAENVDLPVTASVIGIASLYDNTGPVNMAATFLATTTTVEVRYQSTASTTAHCALNQITATLPFTWAASDRIWLKGKYRADARV